MKRIIAIIMIVSLCITSFLFSVYGGKRIKLNKTKANITVGKTLKLKVKNTHKKVKWKTSNKKIATVSKKGKVKGKKVGKVTITAKVGKKKYKCKVRVIKKKSNVKPQETTTKEIVDPKDWDYEYTDSGTVIITGYKGTKTAITIPQEINGIKVTSIKSYSANNGFKNVKEIVIPNNVVTIQPNTFSSCTLLEKIILSNEIRELPYNCFSGCTSLKEITIPNNVRTIGYHCFDYCINLKKVTLPSNLETLEHGAFGSCYSLEHITIPNKLKRIDFYTFSSCKNLQSVTLQNGLGEIGDHAFSNCPSLKKIYIPPSVYSIYRVKKSNNDFVFDDGVILQGKTGTYVETYANTYNYTFEAVE